MSLQTQESNIQMVNATQCSLFRQVLSKLLKLSCRTTLVSQLLQIAQRDCCFSFFFFLSLFFFVIVGILSKKKLNVCNASQGMNINLRILKENRNADMFSVYYVIYYIIIYFRLLYDIYIQSKKYQLQLLNTTNP